MIQITGMFAMVAVVLAVTWWLAGRDKKEKKKDNDDCEPGCGCKH